MAGKLSWGDRLYRGQAGIDFVGRRRTWYIISVILVVVALGSILLRGLNLGIEFTGGAVYSIPGASCSVVDARTTAEAATGGPAIVTETGSGLIRVQTEPLDQATTNETARALAEVCGVPTEQIGIQAVGPTWGQEVTGKAIQALIVFLILVTIFLSIYFEWRMAIAALVALAHDVVITAGIYALTGLQVTPATLIGLLTILGYSLYDTVVVFDKVKEDTKGITGQSMRTYAEAANYSLNTVLVRSINTSITSLLPVLAIIVVGAGFLGAGTLLDLAVALAIGMAVGTYSSVFIATPILVDLKSGQADIKALANRVHARRAGAAKQARRSGGSASTEADADGDEPDDDPGADGDAAVVGNPGTALGPAPRTQPKKAPRSKRGKRSG